MFAIELKNGLTVDVQLQGVGAGLLQPGGVGDPAAPGGPVQAGHHRDLQGLAGRLDEPEVGVRPGPVPHPTGRVAGRRAAGRGAGPELFLEQ
jgi:hypothetical protein